MENPKCVINPKTKRAVKADSKLGKQILESKKEVKPEPKKEPNTMYKKPIGPKVENIPPILKKTYNSGDSQTNKKLDVEYKNIVTKNKDGSMNIKRVVDKRKSKVIDNLFWRKELPTKEQINKMSPKNLIMNMMKYLNDIHAYIKLNVKLEKDDEANFNALYPTIEMFIDQIDKLNINPDELLTNPQYETYQKYIRKYMRLRKIIKGQKDNIYEERPTEYNKLNKYPSKYSKPNYTKDGYFENKRDLYNFLKSLVDLNPEVKKLYSKYRLDISTFLEKLNEIDKRIPPKTLLIEKIDYRWVDEFIKIFGNVRRR